MREVAGFIKLKNGVLVHVKLDVQAVEVHVVREPRPPLLREDRIHERANLSSIPFETARPRDVALHKDVVDIMHEFLAVQPLVHHHLVGRVKRREDGLLLQIIIDLHRLAAGVVPLVHCPDNDRLPGLEPRHLLGLESSVKIK